MALFSLISGTCKKTFSLFFPYFSLFLSSLQNTKTIFIHLLFCGASIRNLNPTNTLHRKTNTLDKFWFQILLFRFSRR